jgi:hypothetical protein
MKLIVAKGPSEEEYKRTGKATTIKFVGNTIIKNDEALGMEYIGTYHYVESEDYKNGFNFRFKFPDREDYFDVFLPEQNCNEIGIFKNQSNYTETYTLRPGEYFGLGVNMARSNDTRGSVGIIREEDIYGKNIFTFFSNGKLPQIVSHPVEFVRYINWEQVFRWRTNPFKGKSVKSSDG